MATLSSYLPFGYPSNPSSTNDTESTELSGILDVILPPPPPPRQEGGRVALLPSTPASDVTSAPTFTTSAGYSTSQLIPGIPDRPEHRTTHVISPIVLPVVVSTNTGAFAAPNMLPAPVLPRPLQSTSTIYQPSPKLDSDLESQSMVNNKRAVTVEIDDDTTFDETSTSHLKKKKRQRR